MTCGVNPRRTGMRLAIGLALVGLALLPVALRFGEPGSEIQAPLAMVIVCGLFSSTALNMFVVPAAVFMRYRERREWAA